MKGYFMSGYISNVKMCQYANVQMQRIDRPNEFAHWHIGTFTLCVSIDAIKIIKRYFKSFA